MDNLNVFTQAGKIKGFHLIARLKLFFNSLKWAYQRIKYGVAEVDTWELKDYIRSNLKNSITMFKNTTEGYPIEFESYESWLAELDKIILHLTNADTYLDTLENENAFSKEFHSMMSERSDKAILDKKEHRLSFDDMTLEQMALYEKYKDECKRIYDEKHDNLKSAFDLIFKYIDDFWW